MFQLLDCPQKQFSWIFTQDVRDPLQNVIVKSVGHSSVCRVSGGGEIPTPQKNQPQQKPRRHVTFTSFSPCFQNGILRPGSAGPEVYSASFVRSSWKQRPKDVERRRCRGGGGEGRA